MRCQQVNYSIYIGYDSREPETYRICQNSILRNLPCVKPPRIYPVVKGALERAGVYTREDTGGSTEFSLTRFLVPWMAGYGALGTDYAVFVDCDFLFTDDINNLFKVLTPSLTSEDTALWCVKHPEYTPSTETKMDGKLQFPYPRKNWSSLMVFNLYHPNIRKLTPEYVNTAMPKTLHRFEFLRDDTEIGSIPGYWNYLSGEQRMPIGIPSAVHFTLGTHETLSIDKFKTYPYSDLWIKEAELVGINTGDGNGLCH